MNDGPHWLLGEVAVIAVALDQGMLEGAEPALPAELSILLAVACIQPEMLALMTWAGSQNEGSDMTTAMEWIRTWCS
ncbi:hypothetical protein A4R35_00935 [Thermogemmatispora tikiterensis]|uniref:Uncharacterized protein n=1 Tax=Thermogemmatispora tikiterensis TaxID=1825093 RepID=A0A328V8X2_9CHLR|nr:hypothetical protein A4R35_00935 [Thermogemmatispora tikiterensis]